jgi:hypothetical protein
MSKNIDTSNNKNNSEILTKEDFLESLDDTIISKMVFLYNAVNEGWKIEKRDGMYVFRKKHENKEEIYSDAYLENFVSNNLRFSNLL